MSQGYLQGEKSESEERSVTNDNSNHIGVSNSQAQDAYGLGQECDPGIDAGLWEGLPIGNWNGQDLFVGNYTGLSFELESDATAHARSLGELGVVIHDPNKMYAVYSLQVFDSIGIDVSLTTQDAGADLLRDEGQASIQTVAGVVAVTTGDGVVLRPGSSREGGALSAQQTNATDLTAPLSMAGEDDFLRIFEVGLRDTGLSMVQACYEAALQKQQELMGGLPEADVEAIDTALSELATIRQQQADLSPAAGQPCNASHTGAAIEMLEQRAQAVLQGYPLLKRVDIVEFSRLTTEARADVLRVICGGVVEDALATRDNLLSGKLDLWTLEPVVRAALIDLSVTGDRYAMVMDTHTQAKRQEVFWQAAMGLFSLALGIGAVLATGGIGAGLAGAAFGLGMIDTIMMTDQFSTQSAAAGAAMDPDAAFIHQDDLTDDQLWLAMAWIGVGLDVAGALRFARLGTSLDDAARHMTGRASSSWDDLTPKEKGTLIKQGNGGEQVLWKGSDTEPEIRVTDSVDQYKAHGITDYDGNIRIGTRMRGVDGLRVYFHEKFHSLVSMKIKKLSGGADLLKRGHEFCMKKLYCLSMWRRCVRRLIVRAKY